MKANKTDQPAEAADEEVGLCCRNCGCRHFFVLYTKSVRGGRILRRRECRHCGKRVTTYEKA